MLDPSRSVDGDEVNAGRLTNVEMWRAGHLEVEVLTFDGSRSARRLLVEDGTRPEDCADCCRSLDLRVTPLPACDDFLVVATPIA